MMKKLLSVLSVAAFLMACATDGSMNPTATTANNIGMSIFRTAVDQQCRVELNNRNEYKILTSVLTAEKKQDIENQVCGCVAVWVKKQLKT